MTMFLSAIFLRLGMKAKQPSEAQIQRSIVTYLSIVLPNDYRCFAIPNASRRTASGFAMNAVAGLTKGVPDLCLLGPLGRSHWIEVKTAKGKLSKEQDDFGNWCVLNGVPWCLVRSVEDVQTCLKAWNIPTKKAAWQ
jgi:hypothetical protein